MQTFHFCVILLCFFENIYKFVRKFVETVSSKFMEITLDLLAIFYDMMQ